MQKVRKYEKFWFFARLENTAKAKKEVSCPQSRKKGEDATIGEGRWGVKKKGERRSRKIIERSEHAVEG